MSTIEPRPRPTDIELARLAQRVTACGWDHPWLPDLAAAADDHQGADPKPRPT